MMNIRRIFSIALLAMVTAFSAFAAGNEAKTLVDNAVKKLKSAGSVSVAFTISQNGGTQTGHLTISGKRFAIQSAEARIWFDGRTQWTYSVQGNEVDITTPTTAELAQSNPMSVLTAAQGDYRMKLLSSGARPRVELTPTKSADFKRAIVTFGSAGMPSQIVVTDNNNATTTIAISQLKTGGKLGVNAFRFNPKDFPGVEVVDLR